MPKDLGCEDDLKFSERNPGAWCENYEPPQHSSFQIHTLWYLRNNSQTNLCIGE